MNGAKFNLISFIVRKRQCVLSRSFGLILLSILVLLSLSCNQERTGLNPGDFAFKFTLKDLDGKEVNLIDYRGKVVLLNFWATWCAPCLVEMPDLEGIYRRFKDRGFVVVAVGAQDSLENLKSFRDDSGISFPVLHDFSGKVQRQYRVHAFPESFIIDRKGKLVMLQDPETGMPVVKLVGPRNWNSGNITQTLEKLLSK